MIARSALRASAFRAPAFRASASSPILAQRGFHTTRARLSSPYHYPEGPRSNIPFNPLSKYFFYQYWGTMGESDSSCPASLLMRRKAFFFSIPFIIAGTFIIVAKVITVSKAVLQSGKRRRTAPSLWTRASFAQIRSSFTGLWQRLSRGSCTLHNSEQNSDQQAD